MFVPVFFLNRSGFWDKKKLCANVSRCTFIRKWFETSSTVWYMSCSWCRNDSCAVVYNHYLCFFSSCHAIYHQYHLDIT
jgi:hypothetical protein